jgi:uncharacterized protein YbgA (DUF1722 family)
MPKAGRDYTLPMHTYSRRRAAELDAEGLAGYVFKKNSPTCGLRSVKVYRESGAPVRSGRGLFAQAISQRFPHLPIEDEGRLRDIGIRENFVVHVTAYERWRRMGAAGLTPAGLLRFHRSYKLTLMARDPVGARRLGRLLSRVGRAPSLDQLAAKYLDGFTRIMRVVPPRGRTVNVLEHALGHISKCIDSSDRAELLDSIRQYRDQLVPLLVPQSLIRHHARKTDATYLQEQVYLQHSETRPRGWL